VLGRGGGTRKGVWVRLLFACAREVALHQGLKADVGDKASLSCIADPIGEAVSGEEGLRGKLVGGVDVSIEVRS